MYRAAQYVRMSTEHQQYSTENQGDKIREYAARRNIEIVRTYADEGKSGLRIDGRQALQQLIADVQAGKADFPAGVVAQIQGHKPSATAEKHYRVRPLDLLRVHHQRIEAWMLEQAGIEFKPAADSPNLRVVSK